MRTSSGIGLAALWLSVTVATGCGQATSVTQPSGVTATAGQSVTTQAGNGAGPSDNAAASALLASVRQATAAYHDVEKAKLAGYVLDPVCISSPLGTMGIHALNEGLLGPGVEADRPEALLFLPKAGGGVNLVAVEYLEFVMLRYPDGSIRPWVSPDKWPDTHTVVNPHPELFGQKFDGPMAGHSPTMPWHWDLHVWAWQPNPSGMFAQFNPRLSCTP